MQAGTGLIPAAGAHTCGAARHYPLCRLSGLHLKGIFSCFFLYFSYSYMLTWSLPSTSASSTLIRSVLDVGIFLPT